MKNTAQAMIRWVPPSRGGRAAPPVGPQHVSVVRFEDRRDQWPHEAWSISLDFIREFGEPHEATLAKVSFLSADAPAEMLCEGSRFEICEGPRVVAKGIVLPESVDIPNHIDEFSLALIG